MSVLVGSRVYGFHSAFRSGIIESLVSYHSMSRVRRVGVEYAIRSGIVTGGVHGIGAGFVEGRLYHNSKLPD